MSDLSPQCIASILHPGGPRVVRFLPDQRVVTGTAEGALLVWDVEAGQVVERLAGHSAEVACMVVTADEGLLTGAEDGRVKEWRPRPVEEEGCSRRRSLRRGSPSKARCGSLEEAFMEKERDDSVGGWAVVGGEEEGVLTLALRPHTSEVAAAGRRGTIRVYDMAMVEAPTVCVLRGHSDPVNWLEYSAEGARLASCSDDTTVRLWSAGGEFLASLHLHHRRVTHLCWLGGRLATLSMERLLVWDDPGEGIATTELTRNKASSWTCLAASQDCVAAGTAEDKMVIVWAVATGQVVFALPGQSSPAVSLDFSVDGEYLASTSEDHLVVWGVGLGGGEEQQPLSLGPPHVTRWLGSTAVTAAPDDTNRVAVLAGGNVKHRSTVQKGAVMALHMSEDCTMVVFGTACGAVRSYSTATGAVTELGRHAGPVTTVAVTEDGSRVVSGGTDKVVRLFLPAATLELLGHEEGVRDVRLVRWRGRHHVLSCSLVGRLKLWCLHSGQLVSDVDAGRTEHATCLDTVEREGEALAAVAGVAGGVRVVELQGGQLLLEVGPASCPVRVVRFSPNGALVVTGHDTGAVQVGHSNTPPATLPLHFPHFHFIS